MKEITDLQREMLKKYHLDAMVTMTPENITYVTGAYIPTQVDLAAAKSSTSSPRSTTPSSSL